MTIGNQAIGVQVGSETYSVVVTEEDLEKRKIERERQKRLSQETNRRRKALEDRKKLAEEREARKRSLELSKRRQRQTEATERYQRSHIATKQDKRLKLASGLKGIPSLDHVLQQLRSGSTEIIYNNRPDPNSVISSTQLTNHGRTQFENQIQEQQKKMLEQHKLNTMQEFHSELHGDIDGTTSNKVDDDVSDADSLEAEELQQHNDSKPFYRAYSNYPAYTHSNVDLMSGRTYGPYYAVPDPESEPITQPQTKETNQLAESLSRLFVKQSQTTSGQGPEDSWTQANNTQPVEIEETDDVVNKPLQSAKAVVPDSSVTSHAHIDIPHGQSTHSTHRHGQHEHKATVSSDNALLDDQDSLHGSSSSGNSPVYSHMTSFQQKYLDERGGGFAVADQQRTEPPASLTMGTLNREHNLPAYQRDSAYHGEPAFAREQAFSRDSQAHEQTRSNEHGNVSAEPFKHTSDSLTAKHEDRSLGPKTHPSIAESHPSLNSTSTSQSVSRAPPNYYVKSYRPWSASSRPSQPAENVSQVPQPSAMRRPLSATIARPQSASRDSNSRPVSDRPQETSLPVQLESKLIEQLQETNARWANFSKTTATPISTSYGESSRRTSNDPVRSTIVAVQQPPASSTSGMQSSSKTATTVSFRDSDTLLAPSGQPSGFPDSGESYSSEYATTDVEKSASKPVTPTKGILKKVSKYETGRRGSYPHPSYKSAAVARQQWVNHITGTPYRRPSHSAKLNGTEVRDSIEARKASDGIASPKSVRWHEVHYSDGTSAVISESGAAILKPPTLEQDAQVAVAKPASPRGGAKGARAKSAPAGKARQKPAPAKGGKKGTKGGGRGRKLKPSKETEVALEPHPPQAPKKQLTMTTTINYSITNSQPTQKAMNELPAKSGHRVAWAVKEEAVTMDTLKSSGSPEPTSSDGRESRFIAHEHGNQVTIHMRSSEKPEPITEETDSDSSLNLGKTPTEDEINWLWTKVRSCLAQRPPCRASSSSLRKSISDTSRYSSPTSRRSAYSAPPGGHHTPQQQASIVSIDGGLLGRDNFAGQAVAGRGRGRRFIRPSSAMVLPGRQTMNTDGYGSFLRRQALLQQRRQKQYMPRGARTDLMKGIVNYPSPIPSSFAPLNPSSSSGSASERVSESTTAFLLAETLAEQNMSEEQITHAMDSLQRRTKDAQKFGKTVVPSSLSLEEQRLLSSLERLNIKLREVEAAVATNPNTTFFNANAAAANDRPMPSFKHVNQRGVPTGYQRPRGRY